MGVLQRLNRAQSGNIGMVFAFAVFGLVIAAGIALDYGRLLKARSALQAAADSAALAAGAMVSPDQNAMKAYAQKYLQTNSYDGVVDSIDSVSIDSDPNTHSIAVHIQGKLRTSFMSLAGYQSMDVDAYSQAVGGLSEAPLELALVLDTTGSMSGTKLDTLKTAAKALTSEVLDSSSDTKVGIVPFSYYVNVGTSHRGDSWLSVPADYYSPPGCYNTYPNKTGCTTTTGTCYNDGVPYSCTSESCTDYGQPVQQCYGAYLNTWYGCVGSRPPPLNAQIDTLSTTYPGLLNTSCASPLTDLTDAKTDLFNAIDNLSSYGDTFIPGGLLWGWNILDPAVPFTNAASVADLAAKGGKKAMVLMTDGANTLYEASAGAHWSCLPDCSATDTLTLQLCQNIKASGVVLYTILFDVSDPKIESMLQTCASDAGKSYVAADNAGLLSAFAQIGKSLGNLRLAR